LTGKRQRLENEINNATSIAEVEGIIW